VLFRSDDVSAGDDSGGSGGAGGQIARIEAFRRRTHAILDGGATPIDGRDAYAALWPAAAKTLRDYGVARGDLDGMIEGQLLDKRRNRYATFDELYDYCYKVASTVGLVCLSVWGYEGGEDTRQLAVQRGVALQLTNILRDLVEDAGRDLVYLPAEDLSHAGYDGADAFRAAVMERQADERFDRLMAQEIERARGYYAGSAGLEARISAEARPTCWAMMRIYRGLLDRIAADPRRVLRQRVSVSTPMKLAIGLRAVWGKGLR
jgi:15-cis-phytoene synthase